jgi:hypothetical protein
MMNKGGKKKDERRFALSADEAGGVKYDYDKHYPTHY